MLYRIFAILALAAAYVAAEQHIVSEVTAEKHTVSFDNGCGHGTPTLISQDGKTLSTGRDYTSNGPLIEIFAFLQTGRCGSRGEHCTLIEIILRNPTRPGNGSDSYVSLIPPYNYSVASGFKYHNGCNGEGADCNNSQCEDASRKPGDNHGHVGCQANNVDIIITFCR